MTSPERCSNSESIEPSQAEECTKDTSSSGSKRKAEWFEVDEDKNTHVYVTGLPESITEEEFIDLMKKYGIIARKEDFGHPYNIKMYKNSDGTFKGDARCGYARKESVDLAITHLDGFLYDGKHELHCERAQFQIKGTFDPSRKPRKLDKRAKLKQKKILDKQLSWDVKEVRQKKVILKNMFTPQEIIEDAEMILNLKEDVEYKFNEIQCEPKRIDIYDKHPEGVIAVSLSTPEEAEKCVQALNNEFYAQRVITAELWDGKTKYKIKETDEESQKRLEKWHSDIEKEDEPSATDDGSSKTSNDKTVDS